MHREDLISLYIELTDKATRNICPQNGATDYDYLHGRIKGHVSIFELVQERADTILDMSEQDFPEMLKWMEHLIGRIMMPPERVPDSMMPEYYRGKNETLKIGRIIFRMFAKQKLAPQKPS